MMIFEERAKTKHREKRNPWRREPTKTEPTTRHFKNEKEAGAEMRPAIVYGIVPSVIHCFSVPSISPRRLCES